MEDQEISIVINPDGTVDIDLLNYHGSSCEEDMKRLIKAIGSGTMKKKREYFEDNSVRVHTEQ